MSDYIINTFAAPALFSLILALVYFFLYREENKRYLSMWSVSWFINSLGFAANLLNQLDSSFLWKSLMNFCLVLSVLFLVLGSLNFCNKRAHSYLIFGSALAIIWYIIGLYYNFSYLLLNVPIFFQVAVATIITGVVYFNLPETKRTGKFITAGSFLILGINNLMYPFFIWINIPRSLIYLVSMLAKLGIVIGTLILFFEKNKTELRVLEDTQRKQAEMALSMAEDRFSKAFYNSPYPMAIITRDGTYIDANYSFEESTGYHRHEFSNGTCKVKDLWGEEDDFLNFIKMIEKGDRIRNLQFKFFNRSGENRLGLLSAEEIVFDGKKSLLLVINDISDFKKMENEIAHLERLNLIGQMAAGIGHEIRNPLTTIRGFLQILGRKTEYVNEKSYFELMISELDRANSIITEFLSLTKNKSDNMELANLNTILDQLYPLIQADALNQNKNITLEINPVKDFYINKKEIHQLILNLVRNGLEAMDPGGNITMKTYMDDVNGVFLIKDEGKGIEQEILHKLGTPFLTTKPEGTGLGLATCYSIAERNNASIEVETSPQGSTFWIKFTTID